MPTIVQNVGGASQSDKTTERQNEQKLEKKHNFSEIKKYILKIQHLLKNYKKLMSEVAIQNQLHFYEQTIQRKF